MLIILLSHLVFGFAFVRRTARIFITKTEKRSAQQTKAVIGTVILLTSSLILMSFCFVAGVFLYYFALFVNVLSLSWLAELAQRLSSEELLQIVDAVILKMKSGNAFRSAVAKAQRSLSRRQCQWLELVLSCDNHRINQHPANLTTLAYREMSRALTEPHLAKQILENLRRDGRILHEFRRRSGQILLQTRVQAIVLSVMYCLVLLFVLNTNKFEQIAPLLAVSLGLFSLGVVVLMRVGRRYKWKV